MRYAILNLFLAIILSFNIFIWQSTILGVICSVLFIGLSSWLLNKKNVILGLLKFLSIIVIVLSLIYYFYELNDFVIVGFLILLSLVILFLNKKNNYKLLVTNYQLRFDYKKILLILIYLILLTASYFLLKQGSTLESVRTPWALVSKWFFVLYFITSAWLIFIITRLKTISALILSSLHLFFTFSIVNIIFPLGFGYDPFIHQATEKYILEHGFILPKPFYYLGQYSLVVFFTKIFQISHIIIDKNLVPLLASILLPSTIYYAFKNKNLFIIFLFLCIPFSILTFTTPQNLADLLVIILAFLGFSYFLKQELSIYILSLFTIAILFIHPIAGLAAMIFILILWTQKCKVHKYLKRVFYIFLCFSALVAFSLLSFISRFKVDFVNNFNLVEFFKNSFRFFPDLYLNTNIVHLITTIVYFIWQPFVVFLMILICVVLFLKNKKSLLTPYSLLLTFLILLINSILVFSFLDFNFLIHYERGDFAFRIFNLGIWFLVPMALYFAISKVSKITKNNFIKYTIFIILATLLTCSLYFSYPRDDRFFRYRGFNTSIYDFNAVKYLEENTTEPYVVLANQQIGAAALMTYGFRYFDNKYFFYSIPTGGELHQVFWEMVYNEPTYEKAKIAMDLTGVNIVYFYLPDYWFNLKKLFPVALEESSDLTILENGKVWVFKYKKK